MGLQKTSLPPADTCCKWDTSIIQCDRTGSYIIGLYSPSNTEPTRPKAAVNFRDSSSQLSLLFKLKKLVLSNNALEGGESLMGLNKLYELEHLYDALI
jgi:hypothetical protein